MRIALLTDIHGNREAFKACLDDVRTRGVDKIVLLGDYVGYGADPEWCVHRVMEEVSKGAVAVLGNHDAAVNDDREGMNSNAKITMLWTRGQLGTEERAFLAGLPMEARDGTRLYVHSDPASPTQWTYVMDGADAANSLRGTGAQATFVGHVHRPAIYAVASTGKITNFVPVTGTPVPLLSQRRWLVVVGSVGQPRDGNPAAAYSIYDERTTEITSIRVPYDVDAAAAKVLAAGLPEVLARRLKQGL